VQDPKRGHVVAKVVVDLTGEKFLTFKKGQTACAHQD